MQNNKVQNTQVIVNDTHKELENWSNNISKSGVDVFEVMYGKSRDVSLLVDTYQKTSFTPLVNKNYLLPFSDLYDMWAWLQTDKPLFIHGSTGTGKSSLVEHFFSKLGYPVFNLTGTFSTEVEDFFGQRTAIDGTIYFEYGALSLAYKYGGVFLLDEIDGLNPALALGLNTVLEGRPLVLNATGEVIHKHPEFRFVATANTNGGSDHTGLYQGTNQLNLAFMDRFFVMNKEYLPEQVETAIISQHTSLSKSLIEKMVEFANLVRVSFQSQGEGSIPGVDITISTRGLISWANLIELYEPLKAKFEVSLVEYSFMRAIGFKASPPIQIALKECLDRVIASEAYEETHNLDGDMNKIKI